MDRKKSLTIITIIICATAAAALFIEFSTSKKANSPEAPFSVTISPLKQTEIIELNETGSGPDEIQLQLTITGNATYPCTVFINGTNPDLNSYYNSPFTIYDVARNDGSGGPEKSNGNSKTFFITAQTTQTSGTATYYVSIEDSLYYTVNSNNVQVVFRWQK